MDIINTAKEDNSAIIDALMGGWMLECLKKNDPHEYELLRNFFIKTKFFNEIKEAAVETLFEYIEFTNKK